MKGHPAAACARRVAVILVSLAAIAAAQPPSPDPPARPSFSEFLAAVRADALSRGIRPEIVEQALSNIDEPMPIVLERDRSQAETVLSLEKYLAMRLTPQRIERGREVLARHRELLARVANRHGVPAQLVVAIWGAESDYGRLVGIRPTVAALAT